MTQAIITVMAAILLAMLLSMVENEEEPEVIPAVYVIPYWEVPHFEEV